MNPISDPFEKLLAGLVQAGVELIVVGGIACALNDHVRATEDVDILIKRTPENVRRLITFLSGYGQGFGSELNASDFADEEGAIRVIEEFPIDIFTVMGGNRYEDLLRFRKVFPIGGVQLPYLDREGLIELKKESIREKDRLDVIHLKAR